MKNKLFLKVVCLVITCMMVLGLAACGSTVTTATTATATTVAATTVAAQPVSLKFFSVVPDRTAREGKLETMLIDQYMNENPNVKIEVEALQDEQYKTKFKAYSASNSLPDVMFTWNQPSFLTPAVKAGLIQELNPKDYESYNFVSGANNGYMIDGKLYGLSSAAYIVGMFYNKALFDKAGVTYPTKFSDLIAASKALRAKGIIPCAVAGKDKWPVSMLLNDIWLKEAGNQQVIYDAVNQKTKFAADTSIVEGAKQFKALMDTKFFQDSFTSADYGAAQNLFTQEKAAMYYMGSWDMSMASNDKLSDTFKKNLVFAKFPAMDGGKGKDTDLEGWCASGYSVAANSKVKDEAVKFLNYMMKPDNWAKIGWQQNLIMPAQKFDAYKTGKENAIQNNISEIFASATSISGSPYNDSGDPAFKTAAESGVQLYAAGLATLEKALDDLDTAAAKIQK
ncbi:MAG TPA: extracellular solute-binding protein [Ruminiclostridium sp.]